MRNNLPASPKVQPVEGKVNEPSSSPTLNMQRESGVTLIRSEGGPWQEASSSGQELNKGATVEPATEQY